MRRLTIMITAAFAIFTFFGGIGSLGQASAQPVAATSQTVAAVAAAVPAPPAPPGGRIYGPFGSLAACERALQKTVPPAGWQKACFQWDDGNWYIAVWPPQEEHQPTITMQAWHYLISLSVLLVMQGDGNLVVYDDLSHQALWASSTVGKGAFAAMQADGNFVIYNYVNKAVWASNTCCRSDAWLQIQDDGNVVIYNGGHAIWATNTH